MTASLPDFTEAEYDALVRLAASHYRFIDFNGLDSEPPVVLWRHDVDFSPQRALACARIEARHEARSIYFFSLHSDFYNLLEPLNVQAVLGIVGARVSRGRSTEERPRSTPDTTSCSNARTDRTCARPRG